MRINKFGELIFTSFFILLGNLYVNILIRKVVEFLVNTLNINKTVSGKWMLVCYLFVISSFQVKSDNTKDCFHFASNKQLYLKVEHFKALGVPYNVDVDIQVIEVNKAIDSCQLLNKSRRFHLYMLLYQLYIRNKNWEESKKVLEFVFQSNLLESCVHTNIFIYNKIRVLKKNELDIVVIETLKDLRNRGLNLPQNYINNQLANTYYNIKQYKLAISHFLLTIESPDVGNKLKASLYNNIGLAYTNLYDKKKAYYYFNLAQNYWVIERYNNTNNDYDKEYEGYFLKVIDNNIRELEMDSTLNNQFKLQNEIEMIHHWTKFNESVSHNTYINIALLSYRSGNKDIGDFYFQKLEAKLKIHSGRLMHLRNYKFLCLINKLNQLKNNGQILDNVYRLQEFQEKEYYRRLNVRSQTSDLDKIWSAEMLVSKEKLIRHETKLKNYLLLGSIILLSIMVILVFRLRRQKRNKHNIEEKNRIIKSDLVNKELLLKEVHHRVKNNLEIVSSIAFLESNKNNLDFDFFSFEKRLIALGNVHNLLYTSNDFQAINLSTYLNKLCLSLKIGSLNGFNYNLHIDPDKFSMDTTISLGLLTNELITNTIKYANTSGSPKEIYISILPIDSVIWEFIYHDNGQVFIDINIENKGSLGHSLISLIFNQFDGDMNIEFETGKGFKVSSLLKLKA